MTSDLLFELGTEELPSGLVKPLSEALLDDVQKRLALSGIAHQHAFAYATPRRIALRIEGVAAMQSAQSISRRGPAVAVGLKDGQPTAALLGFAKSCGISVEQLSVIATDKGDWYQFEAVKEGQPTQDLIAAIISDAVSGLPIPKPMRWGDGDAQFARPVHWAVLLFGDKPIELSLLGVQTASKTYGHRFHAPAAIDITHPSDYEACLAKAYVMPDFAKRRAEIVSQITKLASAHQAEAVMPESLLDEVTSIVEWPQALIAHFDESFLAVPAEVLIASMQAHQKCFALRNREGQIQPYFITVANIQSQNPVQVVAGNEKVMRARLSDAAFFFNQDRKEPLSAHIPQTEKVVFQARLGSLANKVSRTKAIVSALVPKLNLDETQAMRAVSLSKCDLLTGMVGEFPELQGLMGYYYALHDGEHEAVAIAQNEQYMPRFAADKLPTTPLGFALSLADRLDTLVGIFAIGQKPSGVKDPFKLRRHALAVVRMLIASQTPLSIHELLSEARLALGMTVPMDDALFEELRQFILDRMYAYYQAQGVSADRIDAVRARQEDNLCDLDKRLKALQIFLNYPEAEALSSACKRVNNLLSHAKLERGSVLPEYLLLDEEKALFEAVSSMFARFDGLYLQGQYEAILNEAAALRPVLDAFFEAVMVMVEDENLKHNRLNLLADLQSLLQGVADISLLQLNT